MTVEERRLSETIAAKLFPLDVFTGACHMPNCHHCAQRERDWDAKVESVYEAVQEVGLF